MAKSENTPIIVQAAPSKKSWVQYLFYIILGGATIWGGLKAWRYLKKRWGSGQLDDPAFQAASIIYNAKSVWGDDENAAYTAAKQVAQKGVAWSEVSKAFNTLYAPETIDNYMNFMSAEEKTKFFNTLNLTQSQVIDPKTNKPIPIKSVNQWNAGLLVISTAAVNVRKTAKLTMTTKQKVTAAAMNIFSVFSDSSKSNIIKVAEKDRVIGTATGRTSFDDKAEPSGVLFVEVAVNVIGETESSSAASSFKKTTASNKVKKTLNCWVAASQAIPKTLAEVTEGGKGTKLVSPYKWFAIKQSEYDNTASVSGVGEVHNPDFGKELHAIKTAQVLDDNSRVVMKADSGIILGYPIQTIERDGTRLIQFQTAAGYNWWVKSNEVSVKTVA